MTSVSRTEREVIRLNHLKYCILNNLHRWVDICEDQNLKPEGRTYVGWCAIKDGIQDIRKAGDDIPLLTYKFRNLVIIRGFIDSFFTTSYELPELVQAECFCSQLFPMIVCVLKEIEKEIEDILKTNEDKKITKKKTAKDNGKEGEGKR